MASAAPEYEMQCFIFKGRATCFALSSRYRRPLEFAERARAFCATVAEITVTLLIIFKKTKKHLLSEKGKSSLPIPAASASIGISQLFHHPARQTTTTEYKFTILFIFCFYLFLSIEITLLLVDNIKK